MILLENLPSTYLVSSVWKTKLIKVTERTVNLYHHLESDLN